jgi:hypothetical protein
VVVTTWAVDVPVRELLVGCIADFDDFDVEVKRDACERVVGGDEDLCVGDAGDKDLERLAARTLREERHPFLDLGAGRERAALDRLSGGTRGEAIAFLGRDDGGDLVADVLAGELVLEARDDVLVPVQVVERRAACRGVELFAIAAGQGVVDGDDFVLLNRFRGHVSNSERC